MYIDKKNNFSYYSRKATTMHTLKPEKKHEYMIIQKTKGKTVTGSRMKKDKKQRSGNHLKLTPFTHSTQF